MKTLKPKLLLAAVLTAAIVAGCGGGGGGAAPDISQSVSALLDFMNNLIAGIGENGELTDVNALTLAVDVCGEPAAL